MKKLIVTASKLNKRRSIPVNTADTSNVVGTVVKGTIILADEVPDKANPGVVKWYKDKDGNYYAASGVKVVEDVPVVASPKTLTPTAAGPKVASVTAASSTASVAVSTTPVASANDITIATLKQVFPKADDARLKELAAAFNLGQKAFSVDTDLRRAHFFAQMLQEVGQAASTGEENMNYSVAGLKNFSYFVKNPNEAKKYGRTATQKADQEAIANRAYANRLGNGDVASGDGWKYRGKGYIQLTGRSNYESAQKHIDLKLPKSGLDIVKDEKAILTVKGAVLSAMAFFSQNNIHTISDKGATDAVVDKVTAVVNKNTDSYAERATHFRTIKKAFGL